MDADLDTLAVALYARIDDTLKDRPDLVPWRPKIGIAPKLSDAELVNLMAAHMERQPWRYNTRRNAAYALEQVHRHFGQRPISQVRTSDLQAFVFSLDLGARTVMTVWRFLRQTVRAALADGVIGRDPCLSVKLPRHQGDELVVPSLDEVAALRDGAPRTSPWPSCSAPASDYAPRRQPA